MVINNELATINTTNGMRKPPIILMAEKVVNAVRFSSKFGMHLSRGEFWTNRRYILTLVMVTFLQVPSMHFSRDVEIVSELSFDLKGVTLENLYTNISAGLLRSWEGKCSEDGGFSRRRTPFKGPRFWLVERKNRRFLLDERKNRRFWLADSKNARFWLAKVLWRTKLCPP